MLTFQVGLVVRRVGTAIAREWLDLFMASHVHPQLCVLAASETALIADVRTDPEVHPVDMIRETAGR